MTTYWYANALATTAAGIFGTSKGTPIAAGSFHAGAIAEAAVFGTLILVGLTMVIACGGLVVRAWRRPLGVAEAP